MYRLKSPVYKDPRSYPRRGQILQSKGDKNDNQFIKSLSLGRD